MRAFFALLLFLLACGCSTAGGNCLSGSSGDCGPYGQEVCETVNGCSQCTCQRRPGVQDTTPGYPAGYPQYP